MKGKLMLIRDLRKGRCKGNQFKKSEQENQVRGKQVRWDFWRCPYSQARDQAKGNGELTMLCRKWGAVAEEQPQDRAGHKAQAAGPAGNLGLGFADSSRTSWAQHWGQELCLPMRAQLAQGSQAFVQGQEKECQITFLLDHISLFMPRKPLGSFPTPSTDDV